MDDYVQTVRAIAYRFADPKIEFLREFARSNGWKVTSVWEEDEGVEA